MPQTKSAKKALRKDRRRAKINILVKKNLKRAVSLARKKKSQEAFRKASSLLDQAAKKKIIHKNKAARLKSRLAKLIEEKGNKEIKRKKTKKEKES